MKKIYIIVSIVSIILIGTSIYFFVNRKNENNQIDYNIKEEQNDKQNNENETNQESENQTEVEVSKELQNIKSMSISELEDKISKKENFIVVITQTNCGACLAFKPTLDEILIENSLIAYEIDLRTLSYEDYNKVNEISPIEYTPTTLFFKEGIIQTNQTLVGNIDKNLVISSLEQTGFIK